MKSYLSRCLCAASVLALALAVLPGGAMLAPALAQAATFTVTKTDDTDDGLCDADCSLREAITAAGNAAAEPCGGVPIVCDVPPETVIVPPGTYLIPLGVLSVSTVCCNTGAHGELSILGAGSGRTVIDAQLAHRAVEVEFGTVAWLRGMTIRNGRFGGNDEPGCSVPHTHGGGVHNHGVLTLENVTIRGSSASDGGGLASGTCASFANTVSACPVGHGACATLINVTITGNRASGLGGGIFSGQALYLTNVTIANNTAQEGSAIYAAPPPVNNPDCAGDACTRPMRLLNTIVSARGAMSSACAGAAPLTSLGHNLFTDRSCPSVASDLVGRNPLLARLQADGTLPLFRASPAIDAGTNSGCPATDERGVRRPQGRICDIGAYEAQRRIDDDDVGDD